MQLFPEGGAAPKSDLALFCPLLQDRWREKGPSWAQKGDLDRQGDLGTLRRGGSATERPQGMHVRDKTEGADGS